MARDLYILLPLPVALALVSFACVGTISVPGGGDSTGDPTGAGGTAVTVPVPEGCGERVVPLQPLRRLSATQYRNTIRDLFGESLAGPLIEGSPFPETLYASGFEADAESNLVNATESNAIEDAAERIAQVVIGDADRYLRALMPCGMPAAITDAAIDGCIDDFIGGFGMRAYRRPLSTGEVSLTRRLYDTVRAEQSAREAWAATIQLFVQSPALLYRIERGAQQALPGMKQLTDHEMATRLSYFFLDTLPDEQLFGAAAAGRLSTPAEVAAEARRLVASPRFAQVFGAFHRDWLQTRGIATANKDAARFPKWTPQVQQSLAEESQRLGRDVFDGGDGRVSTLLGTGIFPVNATLAGFYGVNAPGAGPSTWVPVALPNRRGLLAQASFMAALSHPDKTSPIHRGAFFQREILCNDLPPLPGNVDTQGPLEQTANRPTARERLAPLLTRGECSGCHTAINPLGLALEQFDAAGLWRDQENGAVIDATGSLEIDGRAESFQAAPQLLEMIAASAQARECYSVQWYRAAAGRRDVSEDSCSIAALKQSPAGRSGDIRELLIALTQTDGFLYRSTKEEPMP